MNSDFPVVSRLSFSTHFGTTFVAHTGSGRLEHTRLLEDSPFHVPVVALGISSIPDYVFFTVPSRFLPLTAQYDPRVATVLAWQVVPQDEGKLALRNPVSSKFMSFQPGADDEISAVMCDRDAVFEWEMLTCDAPPEATDDPLLRNIGLAITEFRNPGVIELDRPRLVDSRLAGLQTLPGRDVERLILLNDIVSFPWVRKDEVLRL